MIYYQLCRLGRWWRNDNLLHYLYAAIIVLLFGLISVGSNQIYADLVKEFFGTENKKETIEFLAFGIIGILGAINAITINRRANAQEQNNKLVKQGNDDYRFQHLVSDLGHEKTTVRVATFDRFYYLAFKLKHKREKNKKEKILMFEENVFEILCSYLRVMSSGAPYIQKEKYEHLTESQMLFDILFKGKFKSKPMESGLIGDGVKAGLRNVCFTDIDFSDANISGVDFRKAKFNNVSLDKIHSVEGADFRGATINGAPISINDFPEGAACYTDDNSP